MAEGTTKKPGRRFEVTVRISGDTWPDVVQASQGILRHVEVHGPGCSMASGGYSDGYSVEVVEDPAMTHERYVTELDAYLAAIREPDRG